MTAENEPIQPLAPPEGEIPAGAITPEAVDAGAGTNVIPKQPEPGFLPTGAEGVDPAYLGAADRVVNTEEKKAHERILTELGSNNTPTITDKLEEIGTNNTIEPAPELITEVPEQLAVPGGEGYRPPAGEATGGVVSIPEDDFMGNPNGVLGHPSNPMTGVNQADAYSGVENPKV